MGVQPIPWVGGDLLTTHTHNALNMYTQHTHHVYVHRMNTQDFPLYNTYTTFKHTYYTHHVHTMNTQNFPSYKTTSNLMYNTDTTILLLGRLR